MCKYLHPPTAIKERLVMAGKQYGQAMAVSSKPVLTIPPLSPSNVREIIIQYYTCIVVIIDSCNRVLPGLYQYIRTYSRYSYIHFSIDIHAIVY